MKVTREQAAENRKKVVDTAARLFREKGFDGIGVADLMKAAGLTHGGFYAQFSSKEDLAAQATAGALAEAMKQWDEWCADSATDPLGALADAYLSPRHRENRGGGCALAALGSEVPRRGRAVQRAFTQGLQTCIARLERMHPGPGGKARRQKMIATMASLVGGLVLARAVEDPKLSAEILQAVRSDL